MLLLRFLQVKSLGVPDMLEMKLAWLLKGCGRIGS